jgi:hypothetical protein
VAKRPAHLATRVVHPLSAGNARRDESRPHQNQTAMPDVDGSMPQPRLPDMTWRRDESRPHVCGRAGAISAGGSRASGNAPGRPGINAGVIDRRGARRGVGIHRWWGNCHTPPIVTGGNATGPPPAASGASRAPRNPSFAGSRSDRLSGRGPDCCIQCRIDFTDPGRLSRGADPRRSRKIRTARPTARRRRRSRRRRWRARRR